MADAEREEQIADLSQQRTRADRADRADFLEEERADRASIIEDARIQRAQDLAVKQALREAHVDRRLEEDKRRLDAINGSIARAATNTATLERTISRVHEEMVDKIDKLIAAQATRDAVAADRADRIDKVSKNQLDSRTFKIGVAGVIVVLLGVILSLLVAVHVI